MALPEAAAEVAGRVGRLGRVALLDVPGRVNRGALVRLGFTAARVDPADPPWCPPGGASWTINGDPSGLVGGFLSLWLQALHPLALAGVMEHSNFAGDPFGRLQRTASFVTATTFCPGSHVAEQARVPLALGDGDPPRSWDALLARVDEHRAALEVNEQTRWMGEWLARPTAGGVARLGLPLYRLYHDAAVAAAPAWARQLWGVGEVGRVGPVVTRSLLSFWRGLFGPGAVRPAIVSRG